MCFALVPEAIIKIKNTFGHKHKWKLKHAYESLLFFASVTSPYMEKFICLRRSSGWVMKMRRGGQSQIIRIKRQLGASMHLGLGPAELLECGGPGSPFLFLSLGPPFLLGHFKETGYWVGFKPIHLSAGMLDAYPGHIVESTDFLELWSDFRHFKPLPGIFCPQQSMQERGAGSRQEGNNEETHCGQGGML